MKWEESRRKEETEHQISKSRKLVRYETLNKLPHPVYRPWCSILPRYPLLKKLFYIVK